MPKKTFILAVLFLVLGAYSGAGDQPSPNLAKIERRIGKEPNYQGKPGYLLLAFGPEAKHKVWLVLDGNTLYVDRHGTGDLSKTDCRVTGESDRFHECLFKAGDLTLGGQRYNDLQVEIYHAKNSLASGFDDMPMIKEFLKNQPEGKMLVVGVDVPLAKPLPNLNDGSLIKSTRYFGGPFDSTGILQFAARPEDASIIHFGGPWIFGPDGQQKLVRGRNEDLALKLGTPGQGPGTFACICYDHLVPSSAKPKIQVKYPVEPGNKPMVQNYVIEDRC